MRLAVLFLIAAFLHPASASTDPPQKEDIQKIQSASIDDSYRFYKGRPWQAHEDGSLAVQKLDAESEALRVGVQGENNVQLDESLNISSQQSVWQIIASNQNLSTLKAYMEDHIYHIILSTKSSLSYTIFAAINTAWTNVLDSIQQAMQWPLKGVATNSLSQYHIVPNVTIIIANDENSETNNFETIYGYTVTVVKSDGTLQRERYPRYNSRPHRYKWGGSFN